VDYLRPENEREVIREVIYSRKKLYLLQL